MANSTTAFVTSGHYSRKAFLLDIETSTWDRSEAEMRTERVLPGTESQFD